MSIPDIPSMFINLSQSLISVISLLHGLAYLVGSVFVFMSIVQFKKIGERHAQYPSQERGFVPLTYLFIGAMLIMLPTSVDVLSATAFGTENVIAYTNPGNLNNFYHAMLLFIKTVGFIWVVRGAVLLASASQPGVQYGPKGLAFVIGGIFALNIHTTLRTINTILQKIMDLFNSPGS